MTSNKKLMRSWKSASMKPNVFCSIFRVVSREWVAWHAVGPRIESAGWCRQVERREERHITVGALGAPIAAGSRGENRGQRHIPRQNGCQWRWKAPTVSHGILLLYDTFLLRFVSFVGLTACNRDVTYERANLVKIFRARRRRASGKFATSGALSIRACIFRTRTLCFNDRGPLVARTTKILSGIIRRTQKHSCDLLLWVSVRLCYKL